MCAEYLFILFQYNMAHFHLLLSSSSMTMSCVALHHLFANVHIILFFFHVIPGLLSFLPSHFWWIFIYRTNQAKYTFLYFIFLQILVPPVFKKKICDMESTIGSPVKFECEIEETPNVTFKWFKSDSEIRQSDKFRIISWQSTSSLELLNPTKADSGEYSCRASNKHGSDTCSAKMNITGEWTGFDIICFASAADNSLTKVTDF